MTKVVLRLQWEKEKLQIDLLVERTGKSGQSEWKPRKRKWINFFVFILEYFEKRKLRRNHPKLLGKAKYISWSIVNKYREGKVKRSPGGQWNRTETIRLQGLGARKGDEVPIEEWANDFMYAARLISLGESSRRET